MDILDSSLHALWTIRVRRPKSKVGASHAQTESDQSFDIGRKADQSGVSGVPYFLAETADNVVLQLFRKLKEIGPASSGRRRLVVFAQMQVPQVPRDACYPCVHDLFRWRGCCRTCHLSYHPA